MNGRPSHEFGKRRPSRLPDTPPPKRSNHVALLVMGTLAVGGGAYALMPHETCEPQPSPGMAALATPATACTPRSSSVGSGSFHSGSPMHWSFLGASSSSSSSSNSLSSYPEPSSSVSRGGFGSFGRAFAFSSGS